MRRFVTENQAQQSLSMFKNFKLSDIMQLLLMGYGVYCLIKKAVRIYKKVSGKGSDELAIVHR